MPMKLAAEGAEGGALAGASRGDLERGFTSLDGASSPDPMDFLMPGEDRPGNARINEAPTNEVWTEHDAGGFLKRAHGHER